MTWLHVSRTGIGGPRLAQTIISVIFLAGVSGKMTAGYFSGEVFQSLGFPHSEWMKWIAARVPGFQALNALTVLLSETAVVFMSFVPLRFGLIYSAAIIGVVPLVSLVNVFDAMGPLFGLACAGLALQGSDAAGVRGRD